MKGKGRRLSALATDGTGDERERRRLPEIWDTITSTVHYAKVAEIRILKCPTMTNYFPVVFHPGCPKICIELCELPKN